MNTTTLQITLRPKALRIDTFPLFLSIHLAHMAGHILINNQDH